MSSHDFRREGARTVAKRMVRGWTLWLEESASWHIYGSATYGVTVNRSPGWRAFCASAGRFSLNVAKSEVRP